MKAAMRSTRIAVVLVAMAALAGCGLSNAIKGGALGAAAGAAAGAVIGHYTGHTAAGAIAGAAVGGTAGALIGHYMDQQKEEMEAQLEGVSIERVGEGLKVVFDQGGINFDSGSATVQAGSMDNVTSLADILKKYGDTNMVIAGHTDSDGAAEFNQRLSEDRAATVASLLRERGVAAERMMTTGYGESQPIASNDTMEGKQQNRRVEIAIFANDELRQRAENGEELR